MTGGKARKTFSNIIAQGFRFMPLGLVRAENLSAQCMGYLGATLTQVFTRVGGATCHSEMSQ